MNRVFLFGKLTFEPNRLQSRTGTPGASFSLACLDSSGFNDSKSFIRVTAWGKPANFVLSARVGDMLFVEGRLSTYKVQNRQDPTAKASFALQVTADKIYRPDKENVIDEDVQSSVFDSPFLAQKTTASDAELAQAFPKYIEDEDEDVSSILSNDSQLEEESDDE